jgi:hypothetical protein
MSRRLFQSNFVNENWRNQQCQNAADTEKDILGRKNLTDVSFQNSVSKNIPFPNDSTISLNFNLFK